MATPKEYERQILSLMPAGSEVYPPTPGVAKLCTKVPAAIPLGQGQDSAVVRVVHVPSPRRPQCSICESGN